MILFLDIRRNLATKFLHLQIMYAQEYVQGRKRAGFKIFSFSKNCFVCWIRFIYLISALETVLIIFSTLRTNMFPILFFVLQVSRLFI